MLPDGIKTEWLNFRAKLKYLEQIHFPRWLGYMSKRSYIELHGFSDRSQTAYAAVVYAGVATESGEIDVKLLQSKTKVAPVKNETCLELSAATLLANLMSKVKSNSSLVSQILQQAIGSVCRQSSGKNSNPF